MGKDEMSTDIVADTKTVQKVKRPSRHHVIFLNDDYTPMEFVVEVLIQIYQKTSDQAASLMLKVHNDGQAIVGTYTLELAEQKVSETIYAANASNYPLVAKIVEADNDSGD